jgi:hypothetical protein
VRVGASRDGESDGGVRVTAAAIMLARKQRLLERLQQELEPIERGELERQIAELDQLLDYLDKWRPGGSTDSE